MVIVGAIEDARVIQPFAALGALQHILVEGWICIVVFLTLCVQNPLGKQNSRVISITVKKDPASPCRAGRIVEAKIMFILFWTAVIVIKINGIQASQIKV